MRSSRCNNTMLALILLGCGHASKRLVLPFVGRWQAADYSIDVPPRCREATVEFLAQGTFTTRSGDQITSAPYKASKQGSGYRLRIGRLSTNGQPNCQGFSAQYVVDNYVTEMYIEVRADTAWIQAGANAPSMTMTRIVPSHSALDHP